MSLSSIGGIGGVASGLDWTSLIQRLMTLESAPKLFLQQRESTLNARLLALRDVNARLLSLKVKALGLAQPSSINGRSISVAGQAATATATPAAATGSHRVTVYRLATATKAASTGFLGEGVDSAAPLASAGFASTPSTGTFSINNVAFSIGAATTLAVGDDSIVAKINAAGLGITAGVEKDSAGRDNLLKLYRAAGSIQMGSQGDTSNFLSAAMLFGADARSTWTSGALESGLVEGAIAGDVSADVTLSFSYGGTSYTTGALSAATADVTSLAEVAADLEAGMNAALGSAGSVTVSVNDVAGPGGAGFVITDDRTGGAISLASLAGTDASGLGGLLVAGGATLGETVVSFANMGRVLAGSMLYQSRLATALADAMQSGVVGSATEQGKAGFDLDGSETLSFEYHGVAYATAPLEAATAGVTDLSDVAADIQAKMNAQLGGAGSVTVRVLDPAGSGGARFAITDGAPAGGSGLSFAFTGSPAALKLASGEGAEASGAFLINGVAIGYSKYYDSLNDVIGRINASTAGVVAQYDPTSDRLLLTSKVTGGATMFAEDVGGNFLAAVSLDDEASQTLGVNARFSIDTLAGGGILTSSTNTIAMIPGVTLSLKAVSPMDAYGVYTATTVAVSVNTDGAVSAIKSFVAGYNEVLQSLAASTAYDTETSQAGTLNGSSQVRNILRDLRAMVSGAAQGLSGRPLSLYDLGITIGAGGALAVNDDLLLSAVGANPEKVALVLTGYAGAATLTPGGAGSLSSASGRPTESSQAAAGTYRIVSDSEGNLSAYFTPVGGAEAFLGTGVITAGGTNTTLVPGLTLRAAPTLRAGTDFLTKPESQTGLFKNLELYLERSTSSTGVLSGEEKLIQTNIKTLKSQMDRMDQRLLLRQSALERQFTAMETIISSMQSQSAWLTAQIQILNNNWMRGT